MQQLTQAGQQLVNDLSHRYNLSQDAVVHMLVAVSNGGGTMAQFNCPELGGGGQWMQGGMTMVGDMFNHGLKNTVNNLCAELSSGLANMQVFPVIPQGAPGSNQWWPGDLGAPFSSGSQNNIRYAVFPNRLAVELNGQVTVYDTLDNNIGGVSQQQGGDNSLTFSSQYGTIAVSSLPIISGAGIAPAPQTNFLAPAPTFAQSSHIQSNSNQLSNNQSSNNFSQPATSNSNSNSSGNNLSHDQLVGLIEKLAALHSAGALTDSEFNSKKQDLLNRL
jgi:hypothetical protein